MSDYADVVSYYDEELGVEVSYVTSHYDGYDSSTDRYVSVYDYTELKRDMEALRAELAALREAEAIVKALVVAVRDRALMLWYYEANGQQRYILTDDNEVSQGRGKTLAAALEAAGLMEEEK